MNLEYSIESDDGTKVWAGEWGNSDGPTVLLIHGLMQCHMIWQAQLESDLADEFRLIAIDVRGHGQSDKPANLSAYQDGRHWADDIAAVIKKLDLDKPVLVSLSYGGLIILDYCLRHGCGNISGINFVDAMVRKMGESELSTPAMAEIGPGFLSEKLPTRIAAVRAGIRASTANRVDQDIFETWLAFSMLVPRHVLHGMLGRQLDFDLVLDSLSVPALVTHGTADAVIPMAMAEYAIAHIPEAELSIYQGLGHSTCFEDSARFNRELAALVRRCG
jgi:pimeloyl-ACP methyl ester carboxylesterase